MDAAFGKYTKAVLIVHHNEGQEVVFKPQGGLVKTVSSEGKGRHIRLKFNESYVIT